jgi:4-amino-4-deoxy-L-arabinose transferase-like glycosyltransferase
MNAIRIAVRSWRSPDMRYCALLLGLTALMVLPGSITLPMEVWDESRNANNAMEIANHGGWMVPTFGSIPDHWNTKPPLLIWIVAALLRTGLNPMLAVRLPSLLATMGSVLLVYFACRALLRDRLAGLVAGLLLICSVLFMGDHVGRTGDFDAPLSLLCLGFVLCAGRYIDTGQHTAWIVAAGALLFLAVMTKGVVAGIPVPGLIVYAIIRRRFVPLLRDWRVWASVFGVIIGLSVWLAMREHLDPGYIAASWDNDITGRWSAALDRHAETKLFYVKVLAGSFEPAVLLLPGLLFVIGDRDPARRHLVLLMVLTAGSWLVTLSGADTKLYWYVAPALPMLAIAIGVATAGILRAKTWDYGLVLRPIAAVWLLTFWQLNIRAPNATSLYTAGQVWYGPFLRDLRRDARLDGAVIVDHGVSNEAGFRNYNPVARFFAGESGKHIEVVGPGSTFANDATIITCDPLIRDKLNASNSFSVIRGDSHCILGRERVASNPGGQ